MHLERLKINQFKNIEEKNWSLSPKINAIVGFNGQGKTNVLDAVHYLCLAKSFLNFQDQTNITFDKDFFFLEGNFQKEEREHNVQLSLKRGGGKNLKVDFKTYDRLSAHVGNFPLVVISPYDTDLISAGSEVRRRFLDGMISQTNTQYLQDLVDYQRALSQRNSLLKFFSANGTFNADQLESFTRILIDKGQFIFETRKRFILEFGELLKPIYHTISTGNEKVSIDYQSQLEGATTEVLFQQSLGADRASTYTTQGIHKDDLVFLLNSHPIKKFGSQGQQKSFLISLKIAQLETIKNSTKLTPLLLLDDIFDKLDDNRVGQLVNMVNESRFGQIFLTDTHSDRTESILKRVNVDYTIFEMP